MSEKHPKILYVVKRLSGGIFTYLVELSNRLIEHYDIVIAYYPDNETPKDFRTYFDKKVRMFRITGFESDSNLFSDGGAGSELKELVKEEAPDIIHLHGFGAGRLGRRIFNGSGIPMFYTPHGYLFLAENHNMLSRSMYRRIEKNLAQTDCMTIACSKGEFAETLSFTSNATFINNAINCEMIDEMIKDQKVPDHPLTVYTSGLINPQKNPSLFNEIAMAMPDVKFVWIGDGELKYKLTARNVEVTGWLDRKDAIQRANASDVFLLTSLWEGLPMTLLEAMYLKKLSIVSNVVGSRDVIFNGENGFVCDSAAAFVNAINHVKDANINEIIMNAHEDVQYNYGIKKMVRSYDTIYQNALKNRQNNN